MPYKDLSMIMASKIMGKLFLQASAVAYKMEQADWASFFPSLIVFILGLINASWSWFYSIITIFRLLWQCELNGYKSDNEIHAIKLYYRQNFYGLLYVDEMSRICLLTRWIRTKQFYCSSAGKTSYLQSDTMPENKLEKTILRREKKIAL